MAGWRVGFVSGNAEIVGALAKLKSYLDYGTFQPIQLAAATALEKGDDFVGKVCDIYRQRRDVLVDGLNAGGWKVDRPMGTMFVWSEIPGPYADMGSLDFSIHLLERAGVAVSPGVGFGPSGEGFVRFALVDDNDRIETATQRIADSLDLL
jgi:alanine-synthesizing transaminase